MTGGTPVGGPFLRWLSYPCDGYRKARMSRVRIVPIVSYIAPCQASRVDRLKRCLPCHARRAVSLSRVDRVNGKGHDKMIPSRWVRCGLLWNRLDRVSRVSRVMSTMSAVSASVVLWMNIGSSCRVWTCVSVLGRVVCYRGLPVKILTAIQTQILVSWFCQQL